MNRGNICLQNIWEGIAGIFCINQFYNRSRNNKNKSVLNTQHIAQDLNK